MAAPMPELSQEKYVREFERNDGTILKIQQFEVGDVGCVVWDAAIVLAKYLECPDFKHGSLLRSKNVLELGAGTGLVGLQAASLGANVICTDLEEFIPLMEMNICGNKDLIEGTISARTLKWREDISTIPDNLDFVLCADCIYYAESLEPLVETIDKATQDQTTVLCSYEQRTTGAKLELERIFFQLVRDIFTVEEIALENQDPVYRSADIHIMKFRRKHCSHS